MKIKGLTYLKYLENLRNFHFEYGKKHIINQSNESQCKQYFYFLIETFSIYFTFNSNCVLIIFERMFLLTDNAIFVFVNIIVLDDALDK